ncbi:MAG: sugar phosphate isomerase/epimerase [Planctomycetales bacterium]|nr:sugar phosphate isomerase/epimerase [Planctomycetales bacterium]
MIRPLDRRLFLSAAGLASSTIALGPSAWAAEENKKHPLFDISLAQWSLNREFFAFLGRNRGEVKRKLDPQDFAIIAKEEFGIEGVEYVNQFYLAAVQQPGYLAQLKKKAADAGVTNVLIMCDGEGSLGDPDARKRITAVRNHIKWLEWAAELGCHSIRVNAASRGSYREQQKLAADGLRRLTELGDTYDLNVIVENHGGYSSHGRWLATVMEMVDHPRCGTLPDFGNFHINRGENALEYDRYLGTYELMPYAKGVSAKSYAFDESGNETETDFERMLKIVRDSGFRGWVGIEFEGGSDPFAGILATQALLQRLREQLSA